MVKNALNLNPTGQKDIKGKQWHSMVWEDSMKQLKLTLMDSNLIQQMPNLRVDWNHVKKMPKQHKWVVLVWEELEVVLVECSEAPKLRQNWRITQESKSILRIHNFKQNGQCASNNQKCSCKWSNKIPDSWMSLKNWQE